MTEPQIPEPGASSDRLHLKYYMFDWDDNILHMPTRIHLERETASGWEPYDVTTAEFARIRREMKGIRPLGNDWDQAFTEFYDIGKRGDRAFLADTMAALEPIRRGEQEGAPSFQVFKQAVIEGRLFAIITARSHRSSSIRKGVEYFLEQMLNDSERKTLVSNLRGYAERFDGDTGPLSEEDLLRQYLDLNMYLGVTSPEFEARMGGSAAGSESPEIAKQFAIETFVQHILEQIRGHEETCRISLGFSDDDPNNILAIEGFLRERLSERYPHIRFVIYDTSDPNLRRGRKVVIERGESEFPPG